MKLPSHFRKAVHHVTDWACVAYSKRNLPDHKIVQTVPEDTGSSFFIGDKHNNFLGAIEVINTETPYVVIAARPLPTASNAHPPSEAVTIKASGKREYTRLNPDPADPDIHHPEDVKSHAFGRLVDRVRVTPEKLLLDNGIPNNAAIKHTLRVLVTANMRQKHLSALMGVNL